MDVRERLSFDAVSENTILAGEHIHRYEFAADLCQGFRVLDLACGTGYGSEILARTAASVHGVEIDVATVDLAAATAGARSAAAFEAADASAYVNQDLSERYDAIVCFEALEHLTDLEEAVHGLRQNIERGVRLIASVPNSRAFEEENEFHVTDFGYDEVLDLKRQLGAGVIVRQYLAEGSLMYVDGASELDSTLVNLERAEPEYANHYLLLANIEPDRLESYSARLQLLEAPVHNRYMRNLEVANRTLRLRNNELARSLFGTRKDRTTPRAGSAAASYVNALEGRIRTLEADIERLQELSELRQGDLDHRDEMILAQRRELLALRQRMLTPRLREPKSPFKELLARFRS